jgi:hypothetical protein
VCLDRLASLHRDERGTIGIMSVITIFGLTLVLAMVMNAGREVDDKVRLQNAADAAAYSGGVVVARGLNALAFANHLEAEVFGLVAYMRTGRDAGPQKDPTTLNFEMAILDAWNQAGTVFTQSSFQKFTRLGPAIQQKVPLEKNLVQSFLKMTELQSSLVLGPLESILRGPNVQAGGTPDPLGGVIPRFQRAVIMTIPQAAQTVASEIARMHGNMSLTGKVSGLEKSHGRQPMAAVLWRTNVMPISMGNEVDLQMRVLPAFDPSPTGPDMTSTALPGGYLELARCQRRRWASYVLELWIENLLQPFYRGISYPGPGGATSGKMSLLYWIWRIYACGQLNKLLDQEYYGTNVPFLYRLPPTAEQQFAANAGSCQPSPSVWDCGCLDSGTSVQGLHIPGMYSQLMWQAIASDPDQYQLNTYHTFIGVAYWPRMSPTSPVFFRYPLNTDAVAFAQVSVFIPRARYQLFPPPWQTPAGPWLHLSRVDQFGNWLSANNYDQWPQQWDQVNERWVAVWDITNQNWIAKLSPATSDSVVSILQNPLAQQFAPGVRVPSIGLSPYSMRQINTH